ncbi:MAG: branched-chain-amino-acid transaminase [Ectothiorhodospiraceae bacterium]|nr:branched-chain-amino-acid transaminase [Ectothiorhodospiraceae bacterium]MCH8502825.1 branched-chain-amino-acid transaminase [Ectothiorhodospiraceae bacterium]
MRRQRPLDTALDSPDQRRAPEQALCWMNGELMPASRARISVFDHGLLYGDGVFEGIRFYDGHPFRLQEHLQRLVLSTRALALRILYDNHELTEAVHDIIAACTFGSGYLRLVVTRGPGALGLDPASCPRPEVFIIADRLRLVDEQVLERGARLIIASTRRLPADGLDPRIKSLNYLNHILARIEANHAGADEAILLNGAGRVAEGTADNVFIVRHGVLLTPPPVEGALAGITRQVVLELAQEAGIPVRETPLAPYDLYTADECFLTGTAAELIPVASIDGRALPRCPGMLYRDLQQRFSALVELSGRAP